MDRYASLERVSNWNLDFMAGSEQGEKFRNLAEQLDSAMEFMRACGIDEDHPIYKSTEFYTSHESLLLHYEQVRPIPPFFPHRKAEGRCLHTVEVRPGVHFFDVSRTRWCAPL